MNEVAVTAGLTTDCYFCSFLGKEDLAVASGLVFPRLAAAQDSHSSQGRAGDTAEMTRLSHTSPLGIQW